MATVSSPFRTSSKRVAGENTNIVATDGELLMRFARHREEAAFAEVVERHGRLVWLVCQQVLRRHQDVEDAFQATFLILAQRAHTIRASDSAAAWLFKVAQRTALAARKKRSLRREESLVAEPPHGEEALPMIQEQHMRQALMEELRGLPQSYQTPLILRYLEGQSRQEIAEQTDSTVGQVQGRLARGRQLLRSRLARRWVSLSLAAGTLAGATASANAAVSPALVSVTAKSCLALKVSGAAGGASAAALSLAKEGVKAMWWATVMKAAMGVTTGLAVAAIAFDVETGGGAKEGAEGKPHAGITVEAKGDNPAPQRGISFGDGTGVTLNTTAQPQAAAAAPDKLALTGTFQAEPVQVAVDAQQQKVQAAIREKAELATSLEMLQLQKARRVREMEQLGELLYKLKYRELESGVPETDDQMRASATRTEEAERRYSEAQDILHEFLKEVAQKTAALETLQINLGIEQEKLGRLSQLSMDSQVPTAVDFPATAQLNFTGMRSASNASPADAYATRPWTIDVKANPQPIQPRQMLRIQVANTPTDAPINDDYMVEAGGTVALGPVYGRVNVGGMTPETAEEAIKKHLAGMFDNPQVQVTMAITQPFAPVADALANNRPASTYAVGPDEVSALRQAVDFLQQENLKLRKQVEATQKPSTIPH